jgi:hypothetical protein
LRWIGDYIFEKIVREVEGEIEEFIGEYTHNFASQI